MLPPLTRGEASLPPFNVLSEDGIAANVAKLPELLRGRSERVNKGYLPLIIAATFLGKFSCQFEQRLGFVEIDAG